jgi:hypothetical protein
MAVLLFSQHWREKALGVRAKSIFILEFSNASYLYIWIYGNMRNAGDLPIYNEQLCY